MAEADRTNLATRRHADVEEATSESTDQQAMIRDIAIAQAQAADISGEATADTDQQWSDAQANAAYLTAQYAANVTAMNALAAAAAEFHERDGSDSLVQFQQQKALAEQSAWNSQLDGDYLAWQQAEVSARAAYAFTRASQYDTSAETTAQDTAAYDIQSACDTRQEVDSLADAQQTFDEGLADLVSTYRQRVAQAKLEDAKGVAKATRDRTTFEGSHVQSELTDAENAYEFGYVQLDGHRREAMAQAGLTRAQRSRAPRAPRLSAWHAGAESPRGQESPRVRRSRGQRNDSPAV